jgi:hypothetical protein
MMMPLSTIYTVPVLYTKKYSHTQSRKQDGGTIEILETNASLINSVMWNWNSTHVSSMVLLFKAKAIQPSMFKPF